MNIFANKLKNYKNISHQNASHSSSEISPELSVSTALNNSFVFNLEKFPFLFNYS